ncbi:MAG: SurA N-terminal domain-containing protein [Gammaproteobacteria bacterium]|nr:SurA N-terminal domain-containing protein [Gammaproteobacteria bacterium]
MLQKIRDKITGWVALTILGVIAVTFVFFGGANFAVIGSNYAAKVDGSEIGINQFEQTYRQQLEQNPTWAQLPDEYRVQIRQRIIDLLVRERLVELYLFESGHQISDSQVTATIQRVPDFQVDGVFDLDTYQTVLLQNGYTPAQFEEAQRRAMRSDQLQRAIGATALVTPAEYRRYLNLVAEQRLVSLATFDIESAAAEIEVSDEMVTAFYAANDTMFLTPEMADVEYIEVRRDAIAGDIEISEETLQDYYLDSQNRYLQDEQRQARHILILFNDDKDAAEGTARDMLARVQAGESFAELAQEFSEDGGTAAQGGDLGVLTLTQLPDELGSAIFAMAEGEVDGPIESDFGFHVVQLDKILEQGPLPLEQVRGELLSELREREAESAFRELERRLSDALFDNDDMQAIAAAVGLEVGTATGFTRSGGEPFGSNQAAIDAVFDERVYIDGQVSEVIELDANRSAIFKVATHYEASRQPLEEVREEIADTIRNQQAQSIVSDRAEQLMQALDAGEEFGPAAEAAGATVSAPSLISRQNPDLDQAVLFRIFMARKPDMQGPVTDRVAMSDGGYTVFSLEAVLPGRPESIPLEDRDAGKLQLAQQAGAADYTAFVQALYDKADIVINQDIVAGSDLFQ